MCNRTGTIRGRSRHRLAIAAILALALTVPRAEAGTVTATLEAFPPSIDEGGTTNLKLTLVHAPTDRDILYDSTSKRRYYYAGSGSIDSLASATVYSGDGQTFSGLGGLFTDQDNTYVKDNYVTYTSPGTWTASVDGNVTVSDDLYYFYKSGSRWKESSRSVDPVLSDVPISASTQVQVNNLLPSIDKITWDAIVGVGEAVSFSVEGYDPAGIGSTEAMTLAYDFDGDNDYSDFIESGSLFSSGTTTFDTAGTYSVGVKLTDGLGGTSYGSFGVTVLEPTNAASPAVPEPSALTIWASLGGVGLIAFRRRRKNGTAKHAGWSDASRLAIYRAVSPRREP